VKERYQEIDEKNEQLRDYLGIFKDKSRDFLDRFEMSWLYHDAALEGVVYTQQELTAALFPGRVAAEASMMPVVLEIRNHQSVCEYIREEAAASKKTAQITLTQMKRMHDCSSAIRPRPRRRARPPSGASAPRRS